MNILCLIRLLQLQCVGQTRGEHCSHQGEEQVRGVIKIILVKNYKEVNQVRIRRNGARRLK